LRRPYHTEATHEPTKPPATNATTSLDSIKDVSQDGYLMLPCAHRTHGTQYYYLRRKNKKEKSKKSFRNPEDNYVRAFGSPYSYRSCMIA
jgi:hypothetical protein